MSQDTSGGQGLETILFLTVKTFRLQLCLLANTHYPLSAIGTVISSYRALLLRRIEGSEPLTIRSVCVHVGLLMNMCACMSCT